MPKRLPRDAEPTRCLGLREGRLQPRSVGNPSPCAPRAATSRTRRAPVLRLPSHTPSIFAARPRSARARRSPITPTSSSGPSSGAPGSTQSQSLGGARSLAGDVVRDDVRVAGDRQQVSRSKPAVDSQELAVDSQELAVRTGGCRMGVLGAGCSAEGCSSLLLRQFPWTWTLTATATWTATTYTPSSSSPSSTTLSGYGDRADRLARAAQSVERNLAEGAGRWSEADSGTC
jgi:hypothetical protein